MSKHLDLYELNKTLKWNPGGAGSGEKSVREWIHVKTKEAFNLVSTYINRSEPHWATFLKLDKCHVPLGHIIKDDTYPWELVWPLVRFTFHVGNLYKCQLKKIAVISGNKEDFAWYHLLNDAVSEVAPTCDFLPDLPYYDFMILPPLQIFYCIYGVDDIIDSIKESLKGEHLGGAEEV